MMKAKWRTSTAKYEILLNISSTSSGWLPYPWENLSVPKEMAVYRALD